VTSDKVARVDDSVDRKGRTWTLEEVGALATQAQKGDGAALATLKTLFDASHSWWDYLVDSVAQQAEDRLVAAITSNSFDRLAHRRMLDRTADKLAGPRPTALVRLAARRAALWGLEADLASYTSATQLANGEVPSEAVQRWFDRADGRSRKALKTLGDLQRLPISSRQVNVGAQQMKIAADLGNLPGDAGTPTRTPAETAHELLDGRSSPSESAGTALDPPEKLVAPSSSIPLSTDGTLRAGGSDAPAEGPTPLLFRAVGSREPRGDVVVLSTLDECCPAA
jgi:hypothetical protein